MKEQQSEINEVILKEDKKDEVRKQCIQMFLRMKQNFRNLSRDIVFLGLAVTSIELENRISCQQPVSYCLFIDSHKVYYIIILHHSSNHDASKVSKLSVQEIILAEADILQVIDYQIPINHTYSSMVNSFYEMQPLTNLRVDIATRCLTFYTQAIKLSSDFVLCKDLGTQILLQGSAHRMGLLNHQKKKEVSEDQYSMSEVLKADMMDCIDLYVSEVLRHSTELDSTKKVDWQYLQIYLPFLGLNASPQGLGQFEKMERKATQKVIKVEPIRDENLFYEPGDILLGKCQKSPLWPCVIERFMGYDEEEVQVYYVRFLSTVYGANLETYNLLPVTKFKLERIKKSTSYIMSRRNKRSTYAMAIKEAETRIKQIKQSAKNDYLLLGRFMKLYCSDANEHETFIEVDKIKDLPSVLLKLKHTQEKLEITSFCSVSIQINSVAGQENKLTVSINEPGSSCFSFWEKQERQGPLEAGQVRIEIRNWVPSRSTQEE